MVEQRAELKRLTMKARQQAKEEEMANEIVRDGVAEVEEPPKEKEIQPSEALLCENQSCSEIIEQRELPLMKRELDGNFFLCVCVYLLCFLWILRNQYIALRDL